MSNIIGFIRDISIVLSAIGGLTFAIYRFVKNREAEANLQIDLDVDVQKAPGGNLVSIMITIRNLGKAAAYVPADSTTEAICSIRKFPKGLDENQITWEKLEGNSLTPDMLYLNDWQTYFPDEPFIFEPGSIDTYIVVFLTSYHGPVWIRAELEDRDEYGWRANRIYRIP